MIAPLSFLLSSSLSLSLSLSLSNFTHVENEREKERERLNVYYFKIDLFSYNVLLELTNNP